ncbi:TPA: hypothetical protein ACH3X1_001520 [Trebouxia sp. C0004]
MSTQTGNELHPALRYAMQAHSDAGLHGSAPSASAPTAVTVEDDDDLDEAVSSFRAPPGHILHPEDPAPDLSLPLPTPVNPSIQSYYRSQRGTGHSSAGILSFSPIPQQSEGDSYEPRKSERGLQGLQHILPPCREGSVSYAAKESVFCIQLQASSCA